MTHLARNSRSIWPRIALVAVAVTTCIFGWVPGFQLPNVGTSEFNTWKVGHFVSFMLISALSWLTIGTVTTLDRWSTVQKTLLILATLIILGIVIEIGQSIGLINHAPRWQDVVIDLVGAVTGLALINYRKVWGDNMRKKIFLTSLVAAILGLILGFGFEMKLVALVLLVTGSVVAFMSGIDLFDPIERHKEKAHAIHE